MAKPSCRIGSIDVFRGLVIMAMVFVNDVAGVRGIPWWLKHMPPEADGMTFVDLVFPAFLFIVGLSIPFAMHNRVSTGQSGVHIAGHVLLRVIGLLIVGVFMVNMDNYAALPGMLSKPAWTLLVYIGVILVWNQYPKKTDRVKYEFLALQIAGMMLLAWLAVYYRGLADGKVTGMRTQWWGILGLIGWAYLTGAVIYLSFRKNITAVVGCVGILTTLYIARNSGVFDESLGWLLQYVDLGSQIGGHGSIVAAGLAVGLLFFPNSPATESGQRVRWMIGFGLGLAVAGFWLRPQYGISKDLATPAWCLLCSAICCGLYAFLYWLVDVKNWKRPFAFLQPAGSNPLLAYILPSMLGAIFQIAGYNPFRILGTSGLAGIVRSLIFSLAILGLTALLARLKIRLRL